MNAPQPPGAAALLVPMLCGVEAGVAVLWPAALQQPFAAALAWTLGVVVVVAAAWRLTSRLLPDASTSLFLLATCLLGESIASATVALLGLFGWFRLAIVAALLSVLALCVQRWAGPPRTLRHVLGDLLFGRRFDLATVAAFLFVLGVLGFVVLNQVRYTIQDADSMWYHLPMAGEWVRTGSLAPIEAIPLIGVGYPGFRQSIVAFLSLTTGNVHLALLGILELPMLALAVYAVARSFGARAAIALGAAGYAVTTPVVLGAWSTQGNDLSLAIHLLLTVLFLERWFLSGEVRHATLAGLAMGALAAIKFSGPGYAVIVTLVVLVQNGRRSSWSFHSVLAAGGGALLLGSPWYLRNLVAFGNPLYPARMQFGERVIFDGPLGKDYFAPSTLGWNVRPLLDHLQHFSEAHGPLVAFGASGSLLVLGAAVAARMAWRTAAAAALLPLLLFVAFLHHPFNHPWFDAGYTHRYLIVWFCASLALAAAGLSALSPSWVPWGLALLAGAVPSIASVTSLWLPIVAMVGVGTAVLSLAAVRSFCDRPLRWLLDRRWHAMVVVLAAALPVYGLQSLRARSQYDPDYGYHDALSERGWGPCIAFVHRHVTQSRVGLHGSIYFFPLLGEPFANEVFVADDLHRDVPQKTPEQVAAWAVAQQLDYLVCCVPRFERTGSREWVFGESIGQRLLAMHPDRFAVAFESRGAQVLRVRRAERR